MFAELEALVAVDTIPKAFKIAFSIQTAMRKRYSCYVVLNSIPHVDSRFICIVDRERVQLAAAISSYLYTDGTYFAIFGFPRIGHPSRPEAVLGDDDYISNIIATEVATLISNALARMGHCQYLILAGLSDAQRSYIRIPDEVNVIEIAGLDRVPEMLSPVGIAKLGLLKCRPQQALLGLYTAGRTGNGLLLMIKPMSYSSPSLIEPA